MSFADQNASSCLKPSLLAPRELSTQKLQGVPRGGAGGGRSVARTTAAAATASASAATTASYKYADGAAGTATAARGRNGDGSGYSATVTMHGGGGDVSSSGIGLDKLVDSAQAILEAREELDELKAAVEAARDEVGSSYLPPFVSGPK